MQTKVPASNGISPLVVPYEGLRGLGVTGSRSTLRREVTAGRFPAPIRVSKQRPVWRVSDIQRWVDQLPAQTPAEVRAATKSTARKNKKR